MYHATYLVLREWALYKTVAAQGCQYLALIPFAKDAAMFGIVIVLKGELRPEISVLNTKVLTLIKAKSNVFL